jgi:hypothetical protein
MNFQTFRIMNTRRFVTGGVALMTAAAFAVGAVGPSVVAAPLMTQSSVVSAQQNVDWMSYDTAAYLGSIGMDVMVPAWVPSPFEGVAPDVYAGDGSYSLYWMAPGGVPTFLYITGVVGAGFPDGSKADLNVPLSVNTSVQGWPAIQDIGIPAGSSTPIYDQVWWIADGVRYSVESNNIGTDSLTIANSMLYLQAPAPVVEEPAAPVETEVPYVPPTSEPVIQEPVYEEPVHEEPVATEPDYRSAEAETPTEVVSVTNTSSVPTVVSQLPAEPSAPAPEEVTASTGPWSPGKMDTNVPSDGTAGPRPPVIGGDGTGGLYDTSLPRIKYRP